MSNLTMSNVKMKQFLSSIIVLLFTFAGIQTSAQADFIGTNQLASEVSVDLQRDELRTMFARDDVAKQLSALGVNPADAQSRVDSLNDAEVSKLHAEINDLPAGSGALGTIAIVLVILILLDVAGVTDIFPKI